MELTQGVGVCSIAFKERSAADALRAIAAAGADSVELWGQPPHLPFPVDEAWCADLREQASDLGLSFCALGSYYCPGRHPSYDGHPVTKKNQLTAVRALGAPIVRIWPGSAGHAATAPEERERLYAEIRDFADGARDAGILGGAGAARRLADRGMGRAAHGAGGDRPPGGGAQLPGGVSGAA